MRVTDLTKQNSVVRNLANNSAKLQTLQENMASGKRINQLSDDPIGATQAQDFRTKLSYFDRIKQNIQSNYVWLDRCDAELSHVSDMLQRVKTLVLAQSNDSSDSATRRVTAGEVDDIINNLVSAGNAKAGKVFLFGGSKTLTTPLERTGNTQPAELNLQNVALDQRYILNPERYAATAEGWAQDPFVVRVTRAGPMGRALYTVSDDGGKTWSPEKTILPQIELANPDGKPSTKLMLHFKGESADPLGDPLVFPAGMEFHTRSNPPVAYRGNDDKRMVTTGEGIHLPLNVTAKDIFFRDSAREDSVDVFDMMFSLKLALEDNDAKALEQRLGELDRAFDQVLRQRADLGSVRREMEDQLAKLDERGTSSQKQVSELEDLDFPAAVVDMNNADVRNKATLDTSSRLIQPSLLNFLR
jgi:flagellar hook-associated protein 3 FlgL